MFKDLTAQEIRDNFAAAKKQYAALGVDADAALEKLGKVQISLHCWQGDDVHGFEKHEGEVSGGGIMATGNYFGPATNGDMLRSDMEKAFSLIPGRMRCNVHSIYAETGNEVVPRDQLKPQHFQKWMDWSKKLGICLDFNDSFFAHPYANDGATLSSANPEIRQFWIRHAKACRAIAQAMGENQGSPCVINHWLSDGAKDQPIDRLSPRQRVVDALDEIFATKYDLCLDALESKLFGIASEDYVVGSHEFYMGYCMTRNKMLCFDMGHFHPTETIHDKISSVLLFQKEILLHVSRGIRWDSDHVVNFNDDLRNLFQQVVRCNALDKMHIALDFFDGSINRLGAWVIGSRATQKAILAALLEPTDLLRKFENDGDGAMKLALLEELKTYPIGAVWDMFCLINNVPANSAWIENLIDFDRNVSRKR
jgi:L-rhamnose isomerase